MSESPDPVAPEPPVVLRVVRGEPSAEDLAALVAVFASMAGGSESPKARLSAWTAATKARRSLPRPSPDAWRLSLRSR